jgi:hypothetical protein
MTSIVVPLASNGFGSRWNDQELRYCLRSIQKHLSGYGDIFIIGKAPKWCKNAIEIPAEDDDKTFWKERNIYRKILKACEDPRVTDDFLFMNDDHFLLRDYAAGEFPYYYHGVIADHLAREDQYGNTIKNTWSLFDGNIRHYDIHCPILYNKDRFSRYLRIPDWGKKYGYCIKSLYGHVREILGAESVNYPDLKIDTENLNGKQIKEMIAGRHWFSIGNRAKMGGMEGVLMELYPNKSKYEL